jgi:hypothetical protein
MTDGQAGSYRNLGANGKSRAAVARTPFGRPDAKEMREFLNTLQANVSELRDKDARNTAFIRQLIYQRDAALASEQAAVATKEATQDQKRAAEAERDMWKDRYGLADGELGQLEKKCKQQNLDLYDLYYRLLDAELAREMIGQYGGCPQCGEELNCVHCGNKTSTCR